MGELQIQGDLMHQTQEEEEHFLSQPGIRVVSFPVGIY